jgi:hypothetical protein
VQEVAVATCIRIYRTTIFSTERTTKGQRFSAVPSSCLAGVQEVAVTTCMRSDNDNQMQQVRKRQSVRATNPSSAQSLSEYKG